MKFTDQLIAFPVSNKNDNLKPRFTTHGAVRSQQRGIPQLISNWLLDYGNEMFDDHGGVVRYFSARSVRKMEREIGKAPLQRMSEFLRCYLVQNSLDGAVIAIGKRYVNKRVWRH